MIGVTINSSALTQALIKLEGVIAHPELISREVAVKMLAPIKNRIHNDGKKADGSQIGTYSNSYLKVREKKNRGADSKVILSLTGKMENDFTVQPTATGYGLGFNVVDNYEKAKGNEDGIPAHTVPAHTRSRYITTKVKGEAKLKKNKNGEYKLSKSSKKLEIRGEDIQVKSYQSAGRKGYGKIYSLTEGERTTAIEIAHKQLQNALQ